MRHDYDNPINIFDRCKDDLKWYLVEKFGLEKEWTNLLLARESEDPKMIAKAAHDAWWSLPDNPSIRVHPFSQLCNMAEQMFQ